MPRQETCSNCEAISPLPQMLTVSEGNKVIARICSECQRAKKISITLERDGETGAWTYYQYFPVEV